MGLLDKLESGQAKKLADLAKGNSRLGKLLKRDGVPHTPELERVLNLPRVPWQQDPEIVELVDVLTQAYRMPLGEQRLFAVQAAALKAIYEFAGAFLAIKMGRGKTLITYLAATVLEVERAVLMVPNSLIEKTEYDFGKLAKHWVRPKSLTIVGYQDLGLEQNANVLEMLDPQAIIADEGFKLANLEYAGDKGSGVAKRVRRCLSTRPDCRFVVLGGTLSDDRPIMQFHHLMRWSLGEKMPMPTASKEALLWARALDIKSHLTERMELGALQCFGETLEEARKGFYQRIYSAPGVVYTPDDDTGASLRMSTLDGPNPCAAQIVDVFNGKGPDGKPIEEYQVPILTSELSEGFFYELDPPPPKEWVEAKREYYRLVRLMLEQQDAEMDTDYQVELKLRRGPRNEVLARWLAVRDMYRPNRIAHWLSYKVIDHVVQTAKPGTVIWSLYQAPGEEIARRHKLRYFHKNGRDATGLLIDEFDGSTCVASISACAEGHNLQYAWHRNRVIGMPGFLLNEQLVGRTHRYGQKADTVYVEYLGNNDLQRHKIARMRAIAEKGSKSSKVSLADWV